MYLNTQWCDYATAGLYFLRTFSANSAATSSPGKKNSPPSPCTNLPAYVFPCVGQASNKSIIKKANPLKDTWYFITVVVSFIFNGCGWTQRKAHDTEWTPRSTGMKFPVTPPHSALQKIASITAHCQIHLASFSSQISFLRRVIFETNYLSTQNQVNTSAKNILIFRCKYRGDNSVDHPLCATKTRPADVYLNASLQEK